MRQVLLQELNNNDIKWLNEVGRKVEVPSGTILVDTERTIDFFYILLDGTLVMTMPLHTGHALNRAFLAIEGAETSEQEIVQLSSGEVAGKIPLPGTPSLPTKVTASKPSLVLAVPQKQLTAKLQHDTWFAARFYRAIAILLLDRCQSLINRFGRSNLVQRQPVRDALYVFGELYDSDIDWFIAQGRLEQIAPNTTLISEGGSVDSLYILLDGSVSLSVSDYERNPLIQAFAAIEETEITGREIGKLSKGAIFGETPFIDNRLPQTTVKVVTNSLVLAMSKEILAAKLQQDIGFASRFYMIISSLLYHRFQGMLNWLGYGRKVYSNTQPLTTVFEYEDELDFTNLDRMTLAGAKFDWMRRKLVR
ncbi:cyclic nucleotide-binding domain-containing protein [Aetokthonos hydrillicola Thurmond2011]|jgi:bacteriocin-type transport-associated protein|uniref:Cyclic nucleotide-binding domain-containing protein n=1 Tax=Aetokthonos hydrillicola Thurmond2011 TaxID=2712845 RepID=A0AAP5MAP1_9CYAN|nr:cyclic nucleotide-binding domain-containing protein [Aetokthonos hydrillicola]MBO3458648.1 cyclic nucleotide-binding domain-containing protein [Aetokthonos hydrillicola CCALA 1050]MBW4588001.1 cyclic nucleotide-binding domain-containing protein [Aetokthonos hydrillicola CCALA 1050]MDR9897047.1 cyclic nucleotide-binding domain-containing protein [Aetokthonos hydrillicola Thurmond2011]